MRALAAVVLLGLFAATAAAAGPPLPTPQSGSAGVAVPGGPRYVTARAGDDTVVRASDGRRARIPGRWAVPAVTIAGGTTGLSADGSTLVLARVERSYPPPDTRLAVLDARTLTVRREIGFKSFVTVDAVAPDGETAYLIRYRGGDPLDYQVRALDTRTGALDPKPVVDPREPDEQMGGLPFARALSRDGRWAYTLYGGGEEVFIHALDTVGRTAACIDLEMLHPRDDLSMLSLHVSGRVLRVRDGDEVLADVDRRTFAVAEPWEQVYADVLSALGWA
ncbi:MAG: hypothetical protein QOD55_2075 [Solirubrobacteraceae bacterium]|jgi:hypothetical protein|nr:hypothetical protein [Solirubrobacteraceae bacterium]